MSNVRKVTNKLLELMEKGVIPAEVIARSCLVYMSEADVADMAHREGLVKDEESDENKEEVDDLTDWQDVYEAPIPTGW